MNIFTLTPECIFYGYVLALDQLSVAPAGAYSLRKLKSAYTASAIRVRRSSDNAETDIGFATTSQTRTNLASIPVNNNSGGTTTGVTMTTLGSGTEFGQSYVDVRWQGIATVAGFAQFGHSLSGAFNANIHAPVTEGLVYTISLGVRLVAGTVPAGTWVFRALNRSAVGGPTTQPALNVPAMTSILQRYAISFVPPGGSAYVQPNLYVPIALNEVVDFTVRFYSANVEQGVGNLRPLLQRNVPEVVAGVGDLDVERIATFVGGENLLLRSEEFDNGVWGKLGGVIVTGNNATAPNGTTTADTMTGTAITPQLILNQAVTRTINVGDTYTVSMWVRNATPNLVLRIARSGAGTYEDAVIPVPVSSVWQRISVSRTFVNAQTGVRFDIAMSGSTANVSLEMWGSQLNQGQLYDYNPTTSTAISLTTAQNAFIPTWYDQGRYWHATKRNLLSYTEEFDNVAWGKNGTIITNTSTAPNNTSTADLFIPSVGSSAKTITGTSEIPSTNSKSIYAKANGYRFIQLNYTSSFSLAIANFDLQDGVVTAQSLGVASIQNVGNGWYRCSFVVTGTGLGSGTHGFTVVDSGNATRAMAMTGDGTSGVLFWGGQIELGSTATEYQPILAGTPLNATQATAGNQPSIVTAGVVNTVNGKPSILYNGTTTVLSATIPLEVETTGLFVAFNGNQTLGGSTHKALLAGNGTSFLSIGTTYGFSYSANSANLGVSLGNGTIEQRVELPNTISNALEIVGFTRTGNSTRIIRNGVLGTAGTQNRTTGFTSSYNIGADPSNTRYYTGGISEITLFASALSTTDRQLLERNQGQYYNITVA